MKRTRNALIVLVAGLVGVGLVMVYNAGAVRAERFGSEAFFLRKQCIWILIGVIALIAAANTDYRRYARMRWPILGLTLALLAGVLVAGRTWNGARRWIRFGGIGFQPSEAAKLGLVIFLAAHCAVKEEQEELARFARGFLPAAFALGAVVVLVAAGPDLGTAALLAVAGMAVAFAGGVRIRHALAVSVPLLLVLALGVWHAWDRIADSYVLDRITSFLDPAADPEGIGHQARQSVLAIGSGGFLGQWGDGTAKLLYLPESFSDFVFAITAEELGFAGALLVILLFVAFTYHGLKVMNAAPDLFGFLLALGITLVIALQAVIHIAVATASCPTKGIGLPFVSYGGSNLVVIMFAVGVLFNVAQRARETEALTEDGEEAF